MLMVNAALERVFSTKRTPEELDKIFILLREPFAVDFIKWKPQATRGKKLQNGSWGKEGQAAAYADPRAYSDRLNEAVGPEGWFNFSEPVFSHEFDKVTKTYVTVEDPNNPGRTKREAQDTVVRKTKLICTVSVGILGVGFHTEVGESWADDENAHTIAYAQAFKRACYHFGLGRYLYDLAKQWVELNEKGFFIQDPQLPDWALPPLKCVDGCGQTITEGTGKDGRVFSPDQIISETRKYFKQDLCWDCFKKADLARRKAAETAKVAASVPGVVAGTANLPKQPNGHAA